MRLSAALGLTFLSFLLQVSAEAADRPKVLFFSNPMQSDNDVIRRHNPEQPSVAERNFSELAEEHLSITLTQDGAQVNGPNLENYDVVVFFTAINPPGVEIEALLQWVNKGGGFIAIHSTANTYQDHAGFGELLGARYDRRPWRTREAPQTKVRVETVDRSHPATRHLPALWEVEDDIYQFKNFDATQVQLLLRLDRGSVDLSHPKLNQEDKVLPIAWTKRYGQGRVFYTALGDWEKTWKDPLFRTHLLEAIRWTVSK